jgi:hypothetical protein
LWLYEISLNRRKLGIYTQEYNELLAKIKLLESSEKKSTTDYYNLKRYDIFIIGGYERLITKVKETDEANFKIYVYMEELYGILEKAHRSHYGSKVPVVTVTVFKYRNKIGKIFVKAVPYSVT